MQLHDIELKVSLWLQLKLLTNGFRLLKVGGSLVYSTCRCIQSSLPMDHNITQYVCISYFLTSTILAD